MIVLTALSPAVPPAVAKIFEEKKKAILSGKLIPFAGPIVDQSGAIKVPAGKEMPLNDLMSLNYYVQGVEGTIPK